MRSLALIPAVLMMAGSLPGPVCAYNFASKVELSASVTVGGTGGGSLSIVATPLQAQSFFGKNLVIPVKVIGSRPLDPKTLKVSFAYVLLDAAGNALTPPLTATPSFIQDPTNPFALLGTVILSPSDLALIKRGGRLQYVFQAVNGGAPTLLTASGPQFGTGALTSLPSPFETEIIDKWCEPVYPGGGPPVSAPDLFQNDGRTSVSLAPGAVSSPGELCIRQEDTSNWPTGPGGQTPVVVYTITLNNTSLLQTANLTLSYPSEVNGQILGRTAQPNDLGIYWLGPESAPASAQSWRILSRSQLDTTKHTVSGVSGHFSTFALFAAGAGSSAASLRPTERIITPNGDGMNDTALFPGLTVGDEIRIFDIRGRRVREIAGTVGVWDGKDDSGSVVESGVYIYQYTSLGERVSGVIMVAK